MNVAIGIITLIVWLRVFFFIRIDSKYGPIIISIGYMSVDVIKFLFFSFIILFGFTIFFTGMLSNYEQQYSSTITSAFNLFQALSIGLPFIPGDNVNIGLRFANLVGIIHFIAMPLIMWNILISIMGSTFSKYKSRADKEHRYIIAETRILFQEGITLPVFNIFFLCGVCCIEKLKRKKKIEKIKGLELIHGMINAFHKEYITEDFFKKDQRWVVESQDDENY